MACDPPSKEVHGVRKSSQQFNAKVYPALVESAGESENLVTSLFSINSALSMTMVGARGESKEQMKRAMFLPDNEQEMHAGYKEIMAAINADSDDQTLEVANRLFVSHTWPVKEEYLETTRTQYGAEADSQNFGNGPEAAKQINSWVEKKTRDKLKNIVTEDSITAATKIILVNAIYFRGAWATWFEKSNTKTEKFHLDANTSVDVEMMHQRNKFRGLLHKELDCQILEMPYKGHRTSMLLFLSETPEGFAEMEHKLPDVDLASLDLWPSVQWTVALPKFRLETTHSLNAPLSHLGLQDIFNEGKADLTGISEPRGLFISEMLQKAFIEVDERGTEAGAVTLCRFEFHCLMQMDYPCVFVCNRPFLFAIRDNDTGCVLFHGRVMDPTKQ